MGDIPSTPRQKALVNFILETQEFARPFATTPDIPPERLAALREAFDRTMADPKFIADAKKTRLDVNPIGGAQMNKMVSELTHTPPDLVEEAKKVIETKF
jgi:hypothetical protein